MDGLEEGRIRGELALDSIYACTYLGLDILPGGYFVRGLS